MDRHAATLQPNAGSVSVMSDLYSRLREFRPLGQLFSGVDVWVMCPFESLLQLLQLLSGEGGATASLLPLQGQVGLRIDVRAVVCAVTCGGKEKHRGPPVRSGNVDEPRESLLLRRVWRKWHQT